MSERYQVIASLMDDPKNLAIILRELARRDYAGKFIITPPLEEVDRASIRTQESFVSLGTSFEFFESLCDITMSPNRTWCIQFNRLDSLSDSNVGPFLSKKEALEEALRYLNSLGGAIVLEDTPWDEGDIKEYP